MKGLLVEQTTYQSMENFVHGDGQLIKRLIIPEKDNLAITLFNNEILVFKDFDIVQATILSELDVPEKLVDHALVFLKAKNSIEQHKSKFENLLK